jgi:hypothetical protein
MNPYFIGKMIKRNKIKKQKKIKLYKDSKEICELICGELGIDFQIIDSYLFRLSKNGLRIDIFPTRKSYFILNSRKRGKYIDLQEFIQKKFK